MINNLRLSGAASHTFADADGASEAPWRGAPWRGGGSDFLLQGLGCVFHGGRVAGASEWGQWGRVRVGERGEGNHKGCPYGWNAAAVGKRRQDAWKLPHPNLPPKGEGVMQRSPAAGRAIGGVRAGWGRGGCPAPSTPLDSWE